MEQLRLFIAIELNDALRNQLQEVQKQLQDAREGAFVAKSVRWVAPQNIHLTLKFLGNSNRAQVPALTNVLQHAVQDIKPFELTARGLGCFPNPRRPNNLWVGLEGDLNTAALLAQQIQDQCFSLNFPREERGFTPHLTIGRVKREASNQDREAIGQIIKSFPAKTFGTISVDAVHLIASDLRPHGPIYTTFARIPLQNS
jgi:RNA 2',3'-cyclic 3'-phosphodiesterase